MPPQCTSAKSPFIFRALGEGNPAAAAVGHAPSICTTAKAVGNFAAFAEMVRVVLDCVCVCVCVCVCLCVCVSVCVGSYLCARSALAAGSCAYWCHTSPATRPLGTTISCAGTDMISQYLRLSHIRHTRARTLQRALSRRRCRHGSTTPLNTSLTTPKLKPRWRPTLLQLAHLSRVKCFRLRCVLPRPVERASSDIFSNVLSRWHDDSVALHSPLALTGCR
jgi:hypothetical protein